MNARKVTLLVVLLLVADQLLKFWVKTHMTLDESILLIPDWFRLHFVENPGFAFGLSLGHGAGKILLSLFRLGMAVAIGWYLVHLMRRKAPTGVVVGFVLILAGALGNILDSAFYGLIFSESTPFTVAHFGGHYAGFLQGRVVDMLYFPLFRWENVPDWLRFLVGRDHYFFGAIFNLADAYISVAVIYLLIFHYRFFGKD